MSVACVAAPGFGSATGGSRTRTPRRGAVAQSRFPGWRSTPSRVVARLPHHREQRLCHRFVTRLVPRVLCWTRTYSPLPDQLPARCLENRRLSRRTMFRARLTLPWSNTRFGMREYANRHQYGRAVAGVPVPQIPAVGGVDEQAGEQVDVPPRRPRPQVALVLRMPCTAWNSSSLTTRGK
jgi:hypothetical protein